MAFKVSNFARMTLIQAAADSDTSIFVSVADAALLPTLGVGDSAPAVIYNSTDREIVYITAVDPGGELTVSRGEEGTAANDWASGVRIDHTPTAAILQTVLNATTAASSYVGDATNVSNAYTVDVGAGNSIPGMNDGERVSFLIPATNTGALTLVVTNGTSSTTSKSIRWQDDAELEAGDFVAGYLAEVRYSADNDSWILVTDTTTQEYPTSINLGPVPAVNRHPNGKLDFWNNGTTFNTVVTGTETADGWYVQYDGSIGTFTVNRQAFTLGQTDVPGDPRYFIRWDQSSGGSGSTLRRFRVPMPGVHWRAGEKVIRRIYAKADAARNVSAKLIQTFGSGGGPSSDVQADATTLPLTTNWQAFDIPITIPSLAGKTIGTSGDALVLTLDLPINVSMTIDFANDDLRPGQLQGEISDTFPVPWERGGTGGSFADSLDFIDILNLLSETNFAAWFATTFPDTTAIEALAGTSGIAAKTAANTWALRSLAVGSAALTITNPAGVAGDPSYNVSTGLLNYHNDPMSIAELASITAAFGTAAFVADSGLVHLTGAETITGIKRFEQATATDIVRWGNTTNSSYLSPRWTDATTLEFVPAPSGTPDATKGMGYDVTNTRWFVDTNLLVSGVLLFPAGSAGAPGAAFSGDPDTGIYNVASNQVGFACGAALIGRFYSGGVFLDVGGFLAPAGSAAAPTHSFTSDTNTGMFSLGADNLGLACGGTTYIDVTSGRTLFWNDVRFGGISAPTDTLSLGYRGVPSNSGEKSSGFTGVSVDAGGAIPFTASATYTIPANSTVAHPLGTVIMLPSLNGGGNLTVHPDTGVTLRRGDGTAGTGDRTVPANAAAWIWKRGTNEWYIFGTFS